MIKKFIYLLLLISHPCLALNWNEMLNTYQAILPDDSILLKQYQAFSLSQAPTIADKRIKEIPICENQEPLRDFNLVKLERIQMLPNPSIPFEAAYLNSGLPNASKVRATVFYKIQKMIDALDELAEAFDYEKGQIDIKIFEGLRDLNTQKMLFENKLTEILTTNPHLTLEMAEAETAKWVSPYKNNVPVHSTGAAVDIRLWDNQNQDFIDMGTFGVIWGKNDNAPTFSENITDDQKKNRLYCLLAAEMAGLTNYLYEFWHFSTGDRYAAYWNKEELEAVYGACSID